MAAKEALMILIMKTEIHAVIFSLLKTPCQLGRITIMLVMGLLLGGANWASAQTGPIGLWHLDETSGASAADSSGNGYNFALHGGYTHTTGKVNEGLTLNGSTGYGVTSSWGQLTGHTSRTICFWFKTTSTSSCSMVSWGSSASNSLCQIGINSGSGQVLSFLTGTSDTPRCQIPVSSTSYADGNWHHLAITYNVTTQTMELYLDAVLVKSSVVTTNLTTSSSQLYLGCSAAGGSFFNGSIDEVSIYNYAISATQVATLSGLGSYPVQMVTVTSPAYCSDISGTTTISLAAPGFTSATVSCLGSQIPGSSPTATLTGTNGTGSFNFPAGSYPHGPLIIQITGTNGTNSDTCYLQVYNTGGTSWNEGVPSTFPPAAAGLSLVYQDDFTSMPSISPSGEGYTYASAFPEGGFGEIPFADVGSSSNPFLQRDSYLRIRTSTSLDSTGYLSSLHADGTGFKVMEPLYFECRLIAPEASGSWPSFWSLTYPGDFTSPHDEEDIIESYGGNGPGQSSSPLAYNVTSHEWGQTGIPDGEKIAAVIDMSTIGYNTGWACMPHVYGMLVGPSTTTFYLDNVLVGSKTTSPDSISQPFYFMMDMAAGGAWPLDLTRYGGNMDMYVDYVRVYAGTTSLPAVPAGLAAVGQDGQVALSWTGSIGATTYNVYRGTSPGGESSIATGLTSTSYTDTGRTNGTTYYYTVAAVNSVGNSGYSSEASAAPSNSGCIALNVSGSTGITTTGAWTQSTTTPGFLGSYYLEDGNTGTGKSVQFTPNLTSAGSYQVFAWWTAGTNRATNVPISIVAKNGTVTTQVNQQASGSQWVYLGTYAFNSGTGGSVTISNTNGTTEANGYVIADAVEFVPAPSVIVDVSGSTGITTTGSWTSSMFTPGYYGGYYLQDGDAGGGKSVQFTPNLPYAGNYQVSVWWAAGTNRATNVPINIVAADGTASTQVDQTTQGGQWVPIGTYFFNAGTSGNVQISDALANGYVIANAVQFSQQGN